MSNRAFANEEVMEEYLAALLTEEGPESDVVHQQSVARLLQNVSEEQENKEPEVAAAPAIIEVEEPDPEDIVEGEIKEIEPEVEIMPVAEAIADASVQQETESSYREGSFQALFFTVAGLTLAVPLTELGGIHNLIETNSLFGKPDWFIGVMLHREEKLSVVDSAKWVMPEKYDEKLAESLNYQYLIMLDDSSWGMACESLVTTATLEQDDVKWREARGKRPWLAGLVKEKKCALIDVKQLVLLLDNGLGSNN